MTAHCPLCGDTINDLEASASPICYRCKNMGGKVRLEIYDKDADRGSRPDPFSDAFLGKLNYKRIRKANMEHGGY